MPEPSIPQRLAGLKSLLLQAIPSLKRPVMSASHLDPVRQSATLWRTAVVEYKAARSSDDARAREVSILRALLHAVRAYEVGSQSSAQKERFLRGAERDELGRRSIASHEPKGRDEIAFALADICVLLARHLETKARYLGMALYSRAAARGYGITELDENANWPRGVIADLRSAALLGHLKSTHLLVELRLRGIGGDDDLDGDTALALLQQDERPSTYALELMARLHEGEWIEDNGDRRHRDRFFAQMLRRRAFEINITAARSGCPNAMRLVSRAYADGTWVRPETLIDPTCWVTPELSPWAEDPIRAGFSQALYWRLRAVGSQRPYSRTPNLDDIPDLPPAADAAEIHDLLASGLIDTAPGHADTWLGDYLRTALNNGMQETDLRKPLAKSAAGLWARFPPDKDAHDTALRDLLSSLEAASRAGDLTSKAILWHFDYVDGLPSGTATDPMRPKRVRPTDPIPDWAEHETPYADYLLCSLSGPSDAPEEDARLIRQMRARRPRHDGLDRIFETPGRLEKLLAFDIYADREEFLIDMPGRSLADGLKAPFLYYSQFGVRDSGGEQRPSVDWLTIRAKIASALSEPFAAKWYVFAGLTQLASDEVRAKLPPHIRSMPGRELQLMVTHSTNDDEPKNMKNRKDKIEFRQEAREVETPDIGSFAQRSKESLWARLKKGIQYTIDNPSSSSGRFEAARDTFAIFKKILYEGKNFQASDRLYEKVYRVEIYPNGRVWTFGKVSENGLIGNSDILDMISLALEERDGNIGIDASLSLEHVFPEGSDGSSFFLSRRVFDPPWIGGTFMGSTLYAADAHLVIPFGMRSFSHRTYHPRWHRCSHARDY